MHTKINYRLCGWAAVLVITLAVGEAYLRGSAPYRVARQFIQSNRTVSEEIGAVRNASGWEGTVHYSGTSGWASFRMNVRGNRGDGVVYITLRYQSGNWSVESARLYTDSGETATITQQAHPSERGSNSRG